ncbi:MAG: monovalent cation/H+ antiporter subunit D family protein [Rhodobacterales bacterium]|nr:monovalent cation/H+ antiporter subunit D family protein [Rhodobacterales bacterium]
MPALIIVTPMLVAPILVFVRHRIVARVLAIATAWWCFYLAVSMAGVAQDTPIAYDMGGWEAPLGIAYTVDAFSSLLLLIVSGIASVVLPFGPGSALLAIPEGKNNLFYASFLMCMAGLMGIAITGDLFNVFVFLEISSLASYTLIAMGKSRRALMAAFSYLVMGTIGGTFTLLGIGMVYQLTGTLNMADIAQRLPDVIDSPATRVALALIVVGGSIKLAVFPLHQWLPNAYTYAPSAVSAFLAATGTKVSYYVIVRGIFTLFGVSFVFGTLHLERLLVPLALLAMFVGSTAAIFQTDLKRLLAYSSIAQIGYMVLGLAMANQAGLTGGIVHLANHAVIKGGLFLVVACITYRMHTSKIDELGGLAQRMPLTAAAWLVGGLGMIGVPTTAGFISKWYLVMGAIDRGWYGIAFAILLSSLLAVVYVWRVVEVFYFREASDKSNLEAPADMLVPTWFLIAMTIVFGLYTPWSAGLASKAAALLLAAS